MHRMIVVYAERPFLMQKEREIFQKEEAKEMLKRIGFEPESARFRKTSGDR